MGEHGELERLQAIRKAALEVVDMCREFDRPFSAADATDEERGWFEGHACAYRQVAEVLFPPLYNPDPHFRHPKWGGSR